MAGLIPPHIGPIDCGQDKPVGKPSTSDQRDCCQEGIGRPQGMKSLLQRLKSPLMEKLNPLLLWLLLPNPYGPKSLQFNTFIPAKQPPFQKSSAAKMIDPGQPSIGQLQVLPWGQSVEPLGSVTLFGRFIA